MEKLNKKKESRVELINCVSWLCLDASWMFGIKVLAYIFIIPTLISGIILILGVKLLPLKFLNTGIVAWSLMNILWMCSEFLESKTLLHLAFACFGIGTFMIASVIYCNPKIKKGINRRIGSLKKLAKY